MRQPSGLGRFLAANATQDEQVTRAFFGLRPAWYDVWRCSTLDREALLSRGAASRAPRRGAASGFRALVRDDVASLDPLDAELALELETRLPSWILVIGDRTAMAHGVEMRVPFLDHRVVELVASMPPGVKMHGLREKAVLRDAVARPAPPAHRAAPEAALHDARPRLVLFRRLAGVGAAASLPAAPSRTRASSTRTSSTTLRASLDGSHGGLARAAPPRARADARPRHAAPSPTVRGAPVLMGWAVRLCAVSVDLDEIPNYFAIHGLPDPTGPERSLVYDVALDRLCRASPPSSRSR